MFCLPKFVLVFSVGESNNCLAKAKNAFLDLMYFKFIRSGNVREMKATMPKTMLAMLLGELLILLLCLMLNLHMYNIMLTVILVDLLIFI